MRTSDARLLTVRRLQGLIACLTFAVGAGAQNAADAQPAEKPGGTFRDCADCPVMVVVPAGSNVMGSSPEERERAGVPAAFGDREGPRHQVMLSKPFALGRTEITRGEYRRFVEETRRSDPPNCAAHDAATDKWAPKAGLSWRDPGYPQTDQHPVVCVSFDDASAYAEWLAGKTGKPYRLASETEWEYAARGGTTTAWYWGENAEAGCASANLISSGMVTALGAPSYWRHKLVCEDDHTNTLPVASFAANPYGLYDMIGNAFEWVEDCASTSHEGAPIDGAARQIVGCQQHFLKGGAFHTPIWLTRAAMRGNPLRPDVHMNTIGFRVARELGR